MTTRNRVTSFRHDVEASKYWSWEVTDIVEPLSIATLGGHAPAATNAGWLNRFIIGDSREVLARLSEDEQVAGRVGLVYFDPPYGARFVQQFNEVGQVLDEIEMIAPYERMWRDGNRSYMSEIRGVMEQCRALLAPHGSLFVQTSDENGHRLRVCLDELFGEENFVATILIPSALHPADAVLPVRADYVHWYARDKTRLVARPLYESRSAEGGEAERIGNTWFDGAASDAVPAQKGVDTAVKVVERCILLATNPGDLIVDPMVGSGTTAFAAEMHGRRWIGIEASRRSVTFARHRLLNAKFPAFALDEARGAEHMAPEVDPRRLGARPETLADIVRVAGPFAVVDATSSGEPLRGGASSRVLGALRRRGITRAQSSGHLAIAIDARASPNRVDSFECWNACANANDERGEFPLVVAIAGENVTVRATHVRQLLASIDTPAPMVIASFRMHPSAMAGAEDATARGRHVAFVHIHAALSNRSSIEDAALDRAGVLFDEIVGPTLALVPTDTGWTVSVEASSLPADRRATPLQWLVDPDFDGSVMRVKRVLIRRSADIPRGRFGRVAVKAIDPYGRETMSIVELPRAP